MRGVKRQDAAWKTALRKKPGCRLEGGATKSVASRASTDFFNAPGELIYAAKLLL
jgi:hypothetical protein